MLGSGSDHPGLDPHNNHEETRAAQHGGAGIRIRGEQRRQFDVQSAELAAR
jgi:hypothetical protein